MVLCIFIQTQNFQHIHTHTHIYTYIYIYIYRERERETDRQTDRGAERGIVISKVGYETNYPFSETYLPSVIS